jgi:group I intron endonuclease
MKNNNEKVTQYYIYKITCKVNHKVYIGQTSNPKLRFYKSHYKNPKLLADVEKYGIEAFTLEFIAWTPDRKFAESLEEHFIDKYDSIRNGYNRVRSFHVNFGLKRTAAANEKRSKAMKRLVWVCNAWDLETKRVTLEEANRLEKQGWVKGRLVTNRPSDNNKLFGNIQIPEGKGDYLKAAQ